MENRKHKKTAEIIKERGLIVFSKNRKKHYLKSYYHIAYFLFALSFIDPCQQAPPIPQLTCEVDWASGCMPDWSCFRKEINSVQIPTDTGYINRDIVITEDANSLYLPDTLITCVINDTLDRNCDWYIYLSNNQNQGKDMYLCGIKYEKTLYIFGPDTVDIISFGHTSMGLSSIAVFQVNDAAYQGDGFAPGDTLSVLRWCTAHELGAQLQLDEHLLDYSWDCIMVSTLRWGGFSNTGLRLCRDTLFCSTCKTGLAENNP